MTSSTENKSWNEFLGSEFRDFDLFKRNEESEQASLDRKRMLESLKKLGQFESQHRKKKAVTKNLEKLKLESTIYQVESMDRVSVKRKCKSLIDTLLSNLSMVKTAPYQVLRRSNTEFIPKLERVVMIDKPSRIFFKKDIKGETTVLKWPGRMLFLLGLISSLTASDLKPRKLRCVYYRSLGRTWKSGGEKKPLFDNQKQCDRLLNDACTLVGCSRRSLCLEAEETGLVGGLLEFESGGVYFDCGKSERGIPIPGDIDADKITVKKTGKYDPAFILLVEKKTIFNELITDDRFLADFPCILVTGKGQPDVATRRFVRKLADETELLVFGLVDADVYGLKILFTYLFGSEAMAFDSRDLVTPDIIWLGVLPSDIHRYGIQVGAGAKNWVDVKPTSKDESDDDEESDDEPDEGLKAAKAEGQKKVSEYTIAKMKEKLSSTNRKGWAKELKTMFKSDSSMVTEGLDVKGLGFIGGAFVPEKLMGGLYLRKDREARAVYLTNLPSTISRFDLKVLECFGPLKMENIRVYRASEYQGTRSAFVEFESAYSKENAIEAKTYNLKDGTAYISEERPENLGDEVEFDENGKEVFAVGCRKRKTSSDDETEKGKICFQF